MTGKAVATTASAVELVDFPLTTRPIPRYQTELPWASSDEDVTAAIAARILAGETMEDVLTPQEPTEFHTLVGTRIEVASFVMRPSDLDEGPGAYAMIAYVDLDTGQGGFTSTGATQVVAALGRAYQLGAFPFRCNVVQVEAKTKGRQGPLYLTAVEEQW